MHAFSLLCIVAIAGAAPVPKLPDLPYTVLSYNYELPPIPMTEGRATNDALFFVRFPQYSISVRLFCPYELIETEFLTKRKDDVEHCVNKADLSYWSKEHKRTIVLDSYEIIRNSLNDRKSIDSITVYKAPEGNTHFVTVAKTDKSCLKMEYKIEEDLKITTDAKVVGCKIVEDLDNENNAWVKEHLAKAVEAAKKEAQKTEMKEPEKEAKPSSAN